MKKRCMTMVSAMLLGGVALSGVATPRLVQAANFFVSRQTEYSADHGGTCTSLANTNLNDATGSFVSAMNSAGWSGTYYTEPNAWPQDFWESGCTSIYGSSGWATVTGGGDTYEADSKNLVVFFGHGGSNWEIWSRIHNGECTHNTTYHTRLGEWGGGSAGVAIWASCSMLASVPAGNNQDVAWQGLRQQFGFSQEAWFYDDDLRDFFNATSSKSNTNAWIDQFPAGRGMPTVTVNSRTSIADCWNNSNGNQLRQGTGLSPLGPGSATCGGYPTPWYMCNTWRSN